YVLNPGTPQARNTGNNDLMKVEPGEVMEISSSAGGGFGSPLERPPERVLQDVREGFVTVAGARDDYGVVIAGARLDDAYCDAAAPDDLRRRMATQASSGHFDFGPQRAIYERTWTPDNYAALTAVLTGVPAHWRFFVKHKIFAILGDADFSRAAVPGQA